MFYNCTNLEYLNIKNIKFNFNINLSYYKDIIYNVPENIVYCINETNSPKLNYLFKNKNCSTNYCLDNWKQKQKIITYINGKYICEIPSIKEIAELTNLISTAITNDATGNINMSETIFLNDFTNNKNSYISYINNKTLTEFELISETSEIIYNSNDSEIIYNCNIIDFYQK